MKYLYVKLLNAISKMSGWGYNTNICKGFERRSGFTCENYHFQPK